MQLGAGWGIFLWILGFVIFALLVALLVKYLTRGSAKQEDSSAALDIAKTRLAKGEITKEEFEAMKKHLE